MKYEVVKRSGYYFVERVERDGKRYPIWYAFATKRAALAAARRS